MEHKKKTSLGRGLGSLFGEEASSDEGQKIRLLAVGQIHPNPQQPRKQFTPDSLDELVASIKEQGVLQPILVRSLETSGVEGEYQLVAGERRWRAAVAAGLSEIPAIIRELNDQEVLEIALLENIQREDLNPVEIAKALHRLMAEFDYTHKKIAERIGKNRITITNYLRILKLPDEILQRMVAGELTLGHAKALLAMGEEHSELGTLAAQVVEQGLSVRETEKLVQEFLERETKPKENGKTSAGGRRKDASIVVMENNLSLELGTRVSITHLHGKGRIMMEYGSLEELERITGRLMYIPPDSSTEREG